MSGHLRVLTNSELTCRRRCAREHHISYELGYRPIEDAEALRFGTMWHVGMEAWWLGHSIEDVITLAVRGAADPYEAARLRVLLRGYDARWAHERSNYELVGVEREFRAPLVNPETGAASRTFELAGKLDVLFTHSFMEHKTTSEEIGVGSTYWRKLTLDPQVSTYYAGSRALGHDPTACVYDVVKKLALRPLKATPAESRKYTKQGHLYANQREQDETVEDYELRCAEEIVSNPDKYYQRGEIVRLEHEEREAQLDAWQHARSIRESELAGAWPRNPDACSRFGRVCGYLDVCCGTASLDDASRFQRVARVHQELSAETQAAE